MAGLTDGEAPNTVCGHNQFFYDTTPCYDQEAAELAWERTLAFFDEHLVEPMQD